MLLPELTPLAVRTLPLPVHRPALPDRWYCHLEYGHNILPHDCQVAVDQHWPSGKTPINYYSMDPSPSNGIRIPRSDRYGSCMVSIETAGPDFPAPSVSIPPDHMRALAGFVIEMCAGQNDGMGGFITHGFKSAENYIAESGNSFENFTRVQLLNGNAGGNFLTVAISDSDGHEYQPGDTEPAIASYLSNYAKNLSLLHSDDEEPPKKQLFLQEARRLRDRAMDMMRGGHLSWWFDLDVDDASDATHEGEMDDTASSPQSNSPGDKSGLDYGKMTYLCDAELGAPHSVDCEKLAWSGLKAPDVIEQLKPETPNIYTSGTCALGISSPAAIDISWAHLLAAFETLNTLCVQNPILGSKGGRAFYGTQSVSSWINGKRDSVAGVNGSTALPVGVNTTIWKHNSDKTVDLKCEWQLAMHGKDISDCAKG